MGVALLFTSFFVLKTLMNPEVQKEKRNKLVSWK
jgi:hypothetical protein